MPLTDDDRRRYARQLLLPEIGEAGQEALSESRVLMIGAGGLGASALSYLAAMGVGTIGIADADIVELSNLNRQIVHETGDIGRLKVASAKDRLFELNPAVRVETHPVRLDDANAASLISAYDLILDGSDNFETRYILNEACITIKRPWIYAAVRGFDAQLSFFDVSGGTPCYRCLVPEIPGGRNDCAERGVIGALVGVIGSMMALEAVKYLCGVGTSYGGHLLRYQALRGRWKDSILLRDPECGACAGNA